jgi:hypothetical protein
MSSQELSPEQQKGIEERTKLVNTFWDTYQESGITLAMEYLMNETKSPEITRLLLPYLSAEGAERNIDPIQFLTDMRNVMEKKEGDEAES